MSVPRPLGRRLTAVGIAAALAVTTAACAQSDRGSETSGNANTAQDTGSQDTGNAGATGASGAGDTGTAGASAAGSDGAAPSASGGAGAPADIPANADLNATFTFAAAGAPEMFDPLYGTDGETFRPARMMYEGLVRSKPGTADLEPQLAESYTSSEDGLTWTFKIRKGVTFSDGTPLNAEAVCYNLERMYSQTGAGAVQAEYWSSNMGGFKGQKDKDGKPVPSIYKSCKADGDNAVITINRFTSKFPAILSLPSYAIQSPTALAKYKANDVKQSGEAFTFPAYATQHPTGTGPMVFQAYDRTNGTITLVRNEKYWGPKATVAKLVFKIIPDETARKQALQAGTIQGYDLPNPADWDSLKESYNLLIRPAFNIMYLGFDFKNNKALQDIKVRKAIAYALNREDFVASQLPEGAEVAQEWYPKTVDGWTPDVEQYPYDPEKAKQLLAEAGQQNLTLNFWWPTEVSRPYMPNPKDVFTSFSQDLEAVGIKLNVTSKPWNGGYLDGVTARKPDLFLLGWTGDYNTPDNFIGSFFSSESNDFATFETPWGKKFDEEIAAADSIPDKAKRDAAYVALNKKIMSEYMPGVPISSSPPALVVAKNVSGIVPSPLTDEDYTHAIITKE